MCGYLLHSSYTKKEGCRGRYGSIDFVLLGMCGTVKGFFFLEERDMIRFMF